MSEPLTVAKVPCGSCPYRRDVPSGIWEAHEYDKLPDYDGPLWAQPQSVFMCHQRDGCLCAGWLACHGPRNLLSIRIQHALQKLDAVVCSYTTAVRVFASGAAARAHGIKGIHRPGKRAREMIAGLMKKTGEAT